VENNNNKRYKLGLDVSSCGYFVLMQGNKIIDLHQVPQKDTRELDKQIKKLKPELKTRGMKAKTEKEIHKLQNDILNTPRDCSDVLEWLLKYADDISICNIEKPLMQTFGSSSIMAITKMFEYLGIMTALLDVAHIPYNIISISEWRANFKYNRLTKEEVCAKIIESNNKKTKTQITREFAKQESIRICEEMVENIKDFYIPKGCRSISNDICESCLLGMV